MNRLPPNPFPDSFLFADHPPRTSVFALPYSVLGRSAVIPEFLSQSAVRMAVLGATRRICDEAFLWRTS